MSSKQYSLIPSPSTEKALRARFPWISNRPLMLPSGWMGLVYNTCLEIEALLAPDNPKDVVGYFFATVRESRLRIFLQLSDTIEGEARTAAIKSLLTEVQMHCSLVCHICGKEILDHNHFSPSKGMLPECGNHDHDSADEDNKANKAVKVDATNVVEVPVSKKTLAEVIADAAVVAQQKIGSDQDWFHNEIPDPRQELKEQEMEIPPPVASIELYDIAAIRKLLIGVTTRYRDKDDATKVKTILTKLVSSGGQRTLMSFPDDGVAFLDQLQADFPNFSQVINMLRGIHALSEPGEVPKIPPLLLLGPPGVGKTMFAEALATGLQVPFRVIRMENQQAGAGLVGSADFWSNSKSGAVFDVLTSGDCGNPILVIDEVDKAATDSRYSPINGLYSLLEPGSAKSFCDESLPDVALNASRITWVLTANQRQSIPEPILSRVKVFEIPKPDLNQSLHVASNIYKKVLNESPSIKARFVAELADEVAHLLAILSPRKMRLSIETALGRAALAGRELLIAEDIDVEVPKDKRQRIGFV